MNDARIRNEDFIRQPVAFSGMRFGELSPTDIDAFLDFDNRLFVFFEVKHVGGTMGLGQRLAYERLADASDRKGERRAVTFQVEHRSSDIVDLATCAVTRIRYGGGEWKPVGPGLTARHAVEQLLHSRGLDRYLAAAAIQAKAKGDPWVAEYEAEEKRQDGTPRRKQGP